MSLRRRTIVFLIMMFSVLVVLSYTWTHFVLLNTITRWEEEEAQRNAHRLQQALSAEVNQLSMSVEDWAYWDDTFNFVRTPNPEYIRSNLTPAALETIALDALVIFGPDGEVLYAAGPDGQWSVPLEILSLPQLLPSQGLLRVADDVYLVAIRPVLDSQQRVSTGGSLAMLRRWDETYVESLAERVGLLLSLQIPPLQQGVRVSATYISAAIPYRDVAGSLIFSISLQFPRDVYLAARRTITALLIGFAVIGMGAVLISRAFLDRNILGRLEMMLAAAPENHMVAPDTVHNDELSALHKELYDMFSRLNASQKKLKYLSLHDQLTGLYNRAYFEEELMRLQSGRQHPVSIVVIDLNGLKLVNDMFGHKKGDELLQTAARVLQDGLRSSDVLARVGGDEFAVSLPGTDEESAQLVIERIRGSVKQHNLTQGGIPLSISLGAATNRDPASLLEDTYNLADSHMYRDKQSQGDSYRDAMLTALRDNRMIMNEGSDGHVRRLERHCLDLGWAMNVSPEVLKRLSLLCRAHDFGYISIPARIVEKPGPLTQDEWELIREHPERGHKIALSSPEFAEVAELVLCHHERWDGQGYPEGLKGEEIPLECRIFAVADAFDMMTTVHGYRQASSEADALEEIRSEAGAQFDPHIAELFIKLREKT